MVGHEHLGYAIFMNGKKAKYAPRTVLKGVGVHKDGSYFLDSRASILDGEKNGNSFLQPKGENDRFGRRLSDHAQQARDAGVEWRWSAKPDRGAGLGEFDRRNGTALMCGALDL